MLALLVAALWAFEGVARQRTMRTGIDLGIYDQAVQRYAHGEFPWSYIKARGGFNLLGDHFSPIVAILGPFYRIWPSVDLLIVSQAIAIGLTTYIVGLTATQSIGTVRAGAAFALAFGLSWGIAGMALFDFHEVALGLPILAVSLRKATQGLWRPAILWSLPLLLVKEDCAFLIAGLALACWVQGRRKLATITMLGAVGSLIVLIKIVIPTFSYSGEYTYLSASIGANTSQANLASHMLDNLGRAFSGGQATATIVLSVVCVGGLCLRSPLVLVAVPPLLSRFTANSPGYWGPHLHYNATLVLIVFMAAIDGPTRFTSVQIRGVIHRWIPAILLASALAIASFSPLIGIVRPETYSCARCSDAEDLLAQIPDGASVIASTYFIDQLVDRTNVHLLASNLLDSTGHAFEADWVALDVNDVSQFPESADAQWFGSNAAQQAGYVPVFATTSGYVLFRYDPAASRSFNAAHGMVACTSSPALASLCSTDTP